MESFHFWKVSKIVFQIFPITKIFKGMKMAKRSKVETSPHYNEIVELLVAGYSGRYVSDYLEKQYDEKITHATLNKYKKNNLNIKAAVRRKIIEKEKEKEKENNKALETASDAIEKEANKKIKAQETFEIAANYRYKDIQKLNNLITDAENVEIDLNNLHVDEDKYDPYREQSLKIQYKKLGLEALKMKYDLIEEDELDVNIHDDRPISSWDSIEKSRQEYLKQKEKEKEK